MYVNIFKHLLSGSETTGPIEAKFHMEPPRDRGTKVCSNIPGHMTKMATMPINGKIFSGTKTPMTLKLGMFLTYPQHSGERYRTSGPLVFPLTYIQDLFMRNNSIWCYL